MSSVVELRSVPDTGADLAEPMSRDEERDSLLTCHENLYALVDRSRLPKHLRRCFEANADVIATTLARDYGIHMEERR